MYDTLYSSVLLNSCCYNGRIGSSSVTQNCYPEVNLESDASYLQSQGYLGTDGTIVGIYGGETPYTLEPTVPKVTDSNLQLDMENKKLNVNLTVSPQ